MIQSNTIPLLHQAIEFKVCQITFLGWYFLVSSDTEQSYRYLVYDYSCEIIRVRIRSIVKFQDFINSSLKYAPNM